MKSVLISSLMVSSVFLSSLGEASAADWYDYGNGKINLENVTHIRAGIDISYDAIVAVIDGGGYPLQVCDEAGGSWTNPLTSDDIKIINDSLKSAVYAKHVPDKNFASGEISCYKNISVSSYIMFDSFKLELFESSNITNGDLVNIKNGLKRSLDVYKAM